MTSKLRETILTGFLILMPLYSAADQVSNFAWPNGEKAAVSLSYDDALNSQLDNAIPALDRHGFRASFYLTLSSETVRLRLDEWRAAASQGHELGNHTLFHPCSASQTDREWVKPWNNLDVITVEELHEHIVLANTMLHAIDGREERTMTAPCGDLYAAGKYYLDAVKPEFIAIKARIGGVTPDMDTLDPYLVEVAAPVNLSGEDLIAMVKEAAEKGTMANLTFHGIGGDYLSVSTEAHAQLLQYLAENRDIYWVDTFLNIMKYVASEN
jgi:peptidoglycan/xylan/chitin deacetylase (PgdA/CDA1 family)